MPQLPLPHCVRWALLLAEQGTPWFALAHGLEAAVAVPLLALAYRRSAGRQLLRPDWNTARDLWNRGRHFLLSGLLVALYGQMDRVMLRAMLGETAVGLYGAASSISTLWIFVPAALVETARPLLLARHHRDPGSFPQKLAALYSVLWYGSCAAGLGVCLLARPLLGILYGSSYLPACSTLWVSAWAARLCLPGHSPEHFSGRPQPISIRKVPGRSGRRCEPGSEFALTPLGDLWALHWPPCWLRQPPMWGLVFSSQPSGKTAA